MNVVGFMSANITTKRKPFPKHAAARNGAHKPVEKTTPLIALLDRIAERGKSIPPEIRDAIWEDLKAKDFCAGSGPIPNAG
jgi:hypothetical protein